MRACALFLTAAWICGAADLELLVHLLPANVRSLSGVDAARCASTPFGRYVLAQMAPESGLDPADASQILNVTFGDAASPKSLTIVQLLHPGPVKVIGDPDAVREVGQGDAPAADLNAKVRELASTYDAWFLSLGPVGEYLAGKVTDENLAAAMQGNLLASVLQASGGLKFETGGVLFAGQAVARTEKDAVALRDVVRFLAGLVRTDKKATLADSLDVAAEGNVVRLSVHMPETTVEKLFLPKTPPK